MTEIETPDEGPKHSRTASTIFSNGPVLSPALYEKFKWFTLIFLPAFSALYYSLGAIWGFPYVEQVVGTAAMVSVFLGTLLGISSRNFKTQGADGSINASVVGDNVVLSRIALPNITPEELAVKKSITIQVNPSSTSSQ